MESWSKEEVGQFISELGFPAYADAFVSNDINGQLLCILDDPALTEVGVTDASARATILFRRDFYNDGEEDREKNSHVGSDSTQLVGEAQSATAGAADAAADTSGSGQIAVAGKPRKKRMQFKDESGEGEAQSSAVPAPASELQSLQEKAETILSLEVRNVPEKVLHLLL